MSEVPITSWSNVCPTTTRLVSFHDRPLGSEPRIARGAGRSFGDAAFITRGTTITTLELDRIGMLNPATETLVSEPGVEMGNLQRYLETTRYAFPVYGGTQWATVGGAAASDIHGKNDFAVGSFGNHVESLVVLTPAEGEVLCSRTVRPDLFAATIGGMGLTGFIRSVTLRLTPASSRCVRVRAQEVGRVEDMLAAFSDLASDFLVCDWLLPSSRKSRGILWHASYQDDSVRPDEATFQAWLPRICVFNRFTVSITEHLLHTLARRVDLVKHVRSFNYGGGHELIRSWNRLFGRSGFIEYHFAVPESSFAAAFRVLNHLARSRSIDLLFGVVKRFGTMPRTGLLSFPMAGYGMNFQLREGEASRRFLVDFTDIVVELGGSIYLAKDCVALPRQYKAMYGSLLERWQETARRSDPDHLLRSDLSLRLELKPW